MPSASNVFVDANVLIYADDERDQVKHQKAQHWLEHLWAHRTGRLSTQVLNEYYAVVTKKIPGVILGDARAKVRRYQNWQPWQLDQQTVETAWGFEARLGYNYWDCLILAAANHSGCRFLLSEDMQNGQVVNAVTIINPFDKTPEQVFASL
jgi:predicted nucleic acid-binding protein